MTSTKWGKSDFWGVSSAFDVDWVLTEEQKKIRDDLIELCRTKIRPHAIECDRNYTYPRKSLDALAEQGLLGLIIPKDLGGMGQNHVCTAMVLETLSRYGDAALAMIYAMHTGSIAVLCFRYHGNAHITDLLSRVTRDKLVGTLSYSDPATGGHFWYHLSSKTKILEDGNIKVLQYVSWCTSAGFADFYVFDAKSPTFTGDYSNQTMFVVYPDEVRANTDDWSALGMHANQSGPMVIDAVLPPERMVGPMGSGAVTDAEPLIMFFLLNTSSTWNGLSMACVDLAKKHVTRKAHADVGMRICDYPSIQDYFGECITTTAVSRSHVLMVAQRLDQVTNNNDWSLHKDLDFTPRKQYTAFLDQAKLFSSNNVCKVSDTMLAVCGGTGFKTELGIERLLRDARASGVMAPASQVLRQQLGKMVLFGPESVDVWEHNCDERVLSHEMNKMTLDAKKLLLAKLERDISCSDGIIATKHPLQDTDFDNPFNVAPPQTVTTIAIGGSSHTGALTKNSWTKCIFWSKKELSENMAIFTFKYPSQKMHSGCLPGQYVQMQIKADGRFHERFLSPISEPKHLGQIQFVMKFESTGIVSAAFKALKKDDVVQFRGPWGGFEYLPNVFEEITLLASGTGVAPALQIIRASLAESEDRTILKLIYFTEKAEEFICREELDAKQEQFARLQVHYSVGEAPENWDGDEGFIDTQMIDKYVTKPKKESKHKIILCGGPTMTVSCIHSLKSLHYPSQDVFIYGQFGTEQVRAVYGCHAPLSTHTG